MPNDRSSELLNKIIIGKELCKRETRVLLYALYSSLRHRVVCTGLHSLRGNQKLSLRCLPSLPRPERVLIPYLHVKNNNTHSRILTVKGMDFKQINGQDKILKSKGFGLQWISFKATHCVSELVIGFLPGKLRLWDSVGICSV